MLPARSLDLKNQVGFSWEVFRTFQASIKSRDGQFPGTGSDRSDFGRVSVPLVVVEGNDGRVFRHRAVAQLLLDQLPMLVLVPGVGGLEASLDVLKFQKG